MHAAPIDTHVPHADGGAACTAHPHVRVHQHPQAAAASAPSRHPCLIPNNPRGHDGTDALVMLIYSLTVWAITQCSRKPSGLHRHAWLMTTPEDLNYMSWYRALQLLSTK